jgi:hypothetical protein
MTKKRYAPAELQSLIELVNSVPPEIDLPDPRGQVERIVDLLNTKEFARFVQIIGGVKPDTVLTKLGFPGAPKTYRTLMGNYILLRDGRAWLRQAATIGQLRVRMHYLMPHVSVHTNEHGQFEFNVDPLVRILEGVEASSLRVCPICGLIYWAARRDKPCCTEKCAGVRRTRHHRESYDAKYGPQRSEKRKAIRSQKEQQERAALAELTAPASGGRRRVVRLPIPKVEKC